MTSMGKIVSYERDYDETIQHIDSLDYYFYDILTRSNDFNQFRDLMMEFLANRPNVKERHDAAGTGKWNFRKLSEQDKEKVSKDQLRIWDSNKEDEFGDKLESIPYFDNIETVTKSFPLNFQRPHAFEKEHLKVNSQSSKEPDIFEGLQIHSQLKGGKNKKTRKNIKPRK